MMRELKAMLDKLNSAKPLITPNKLAQATKTTDNPANHPRRNHVVVNAAFNEVTVLNGSNQVLFQTPYTAAKPSAPLAVTQVPDLGKKADKNLDIQTRDDYPLTGGKVMGFYSPDYKTPVTQNGELALVAFHGQIEGITTSEKAQSKTLKYGISAYTLGITDESAGCLRLKNGLGLNSKPQDQQFGNLTYTRRDARNGIKDSAGKEEISSFGTQVDVVYDLTQYKASNGSVAGSKLIELNLAPHNRDAVFLVNGNNLEYETVKIPKVTTASIKEELKLQFPNAKLIELKDEKDVIPAQTSEDTVYFRSYVAQEMLQQSETLNQDIAHKPKWFTKGAVAEFRSGSASKP
jgi:hypothetical protein